MITHKLNVDPQYKSVKQKSRKPKKNQVINKEVDLLEVKNVIRKVQYPKWLANVVVVKKNNRKNKVCIDFTYSNKACPKHSFSPLMIDMLVYAMARHELLNFLDAFSGYNRIIMHPDVQRKNFFHD